MNQMDIIQAAPPDINLHFPVIYIWVEINFPRRVRAFLSMLEGTADDVLSRANKWETEHIGATSSMSGKESVTRIWWTQLATVLITTLNDSSKSYIRWLMRNRNMAAIETAWMGWAHKLRPGYIPQFLDLNECAVHSVCAEMFRGSYSNIRSLIRHLFLCPVWHVSDSCSEEMALPQFRFDHEVPSLSSPFYVDTLALATWRPTDRIPFFNLKGSWENYKRNGEAREMHSFR